ncbi:MAG: hypothetical protein ACKVZH_01400 [Blastocatellia bacterium]
MKLLIKKQLEEYVFFVDRSLGKNDVPNALREQEVKVEIHSDHFPDDAPDELWLVECGQNDWVVLAKDKQIRYNELERLALLNAGVASFILISGNLSGAEMASAYIKALPKIASYLSNQKKPFIAKVDKAGGVRLWINHKGKVRAT